MYTKHIFYTAPFYCIMVLYYLNTLLYYGNVLLYCIITFTFLYLPFTLREYCEINPSFIQLFI